MIPQTKEVQDSFHSAIRELKSNFENPYLFILEDSYTGNLMAPSVLYEDEASRGTVIGTFDLFGFSVDFVKSVDSQFCVIFLTWIGR